LNFFFGSELPFFVQINVTSRVPDDIVCGGGKTCEKRKPGSFSPHLQMQQS